MFIVLQKMGNGRKQLMPFAPVTFSSLLCHAYKMHTYEIGKNISESKINISTVILE
jgi:hypothetical protein